MIFRAFRIPLRGAQKKIPPNQPPSTPSTMLEIAETPSNTVQLRAVGVTIELSQDEWESLIELGRMSAYSNDYIRFQASAQAPLADTQRASPPEDTQ